MKKLIVITTLLLCGLYSANAQKGKINDVVLNPNKGIVRMLPDLTFDLVPVLITGGSGVEKVPSTKSSVKMAINFIVKNIGLANAKPTMVYAEYSFIGTQRVGTDLRTSTIHVTSESLPIPAIPAGRDQLIKQAFIFKNTPEQAYGKDVKLRLVIVTAGVGSQKEQSVKNNISDELSIMINR
ncbi:MAG: hypothetical protein EOO47_10130 [Flavobacterium sp.]|nr:MAG: hypothetical protein EOO47_10130 [Flavobacterium sp.]